MEATTPGSHTSAETTSHVGGPRHVGNASGFRITVVLQFLMLLCVTLASRGLCSESINGAAGMYVRLAPGANSVFSAHLTLPLETKNKSWYATWIMLVANGDRSTTSFVQCGLLRWSKSDYKVVPFIAYHRQGRTWGFVPFPHEISTRGATSSIALENGIVILSVGGKPYWERRLVDFFDMRDLLYYEVADEVTAYGDSLSGTIGGLRLWSDGRDRPVTPRCGYADSGLSIRQVSNATWNGRGVFTRGISRYLSLPSGATVSSCRSRS